MGINLKIRSNLHEIIPHWKHIHDQFNVSVTEFFDHLVEFGIEYMKNHMMDYMLTGKLIESVRPGFGTRTGIAGKRGAFYDLPIVIGASHAKFVDEGTKQSPGGYFSWIMPSKQSSIEGGRISKSNLKRGQYKPHRGTPARNFTGDTVDFLYNNMEDYFDEVFGWLFR